MADIDYTGSFGGLNTQDSLVKEGKVLYFSESINVETFGSTIRRARGQETRVELPAGVLGIYEHEINGDFFMRAVCSDGIYYRIEPLTSAYTPAKTGLSPEAKPYFFHMNNNLVTITSKDDPFYDDGDTISQTGFYDRYQKHGTCGCFFAGRIFIADRHLLAWSAANTLNDWTTEGDAGYKDNFNGNIVALQVFSTYMIIITTSDIYLMSGEDNTTFAVAHYSDTGIKSRFGITKIDNKLYIWNNGLYPIEYTGDMAQVRIANPITNLIQNSLNDIDTFRLSEIIMVPYPDRKQIWAYVPIKNQADLKCWIINFENYTKYKGVACYPRQGKPITCACQFRGKVYTGTASGKIYEEDKGNLFDDEPILAKCWFTPLRFGTPRIKTNYDTILLTCNAKSINRFNFLSRYDGEFSDPDDTDVDLFDVADQYYILNETELNTGDVTIVDDYVSDTVNILDEFSIIQVGLECLEGHDFILHGLTFLDVNDMREI